MSLRKHLPLIFIFILFSLSPKTVQTTTNCKTTESQALLKFKQGLIDEYNHLSSWKINTDCCKWRGVHCSNITGHVLRLNLQVTSDFSYMPLRGNISSSLIQLRHLSYLDLSLNDFGDKQIPIHFSLLKNLIHLNISHAGFGGEVPYQLSNLTNLQSLDLSYNYALFSDSLNWLSHLQALRLIRFNSIRLGKASDWLQVVSQLPVLTHLQLRWCSLPSINNISSISFTNSSNFLSHVSLSGNRISNSIYPWLFNFRTSLVDLDLSYNVLQGPVSDYAFSNMTRLLYLDLGYNQFESIPRSLTLLCLKTLNLNHNNVTGQLLEVFNNLSICNKHSLENLLLNDNLLTGSLPDFTVFFSSLRELQLRRNLLDGSFPKRFGQVSNLTKLYIGNNSLHGSLPSLSQLLSLKELSVHNNFLNGSLTKSTGDLSHLELLDVSSNYFVDTITEAHLFHLSNLNYLDLSSPSLTINFSENWVPPFQLETIIIRNCKVGPLFPKWIKTQHMFSYLDFSNSQISDTMPNWFWDLSSKLHRLNTSHNQIHGVLPDLSSKFVGYPVIDFSDNLLQGPIPLLPPNVTSLVLSKNRFSGSISFLCSINGRYFSYLDLSDNQLSGSLDDCSYRWQRLTIINFANNNFSGNLPRTLTSGCHLQSLHLRNNSLNGELPSSLTNCSWLRVIDLGQNDFSGKIPAWIGDGLSDLAVLSLRSNQFQGTLPLELCRLTKLQVLDFSFNNISGNIPECIVDLTMMSHKESLNPIITYPFPVSIFDRSYKRSYGIEGNYHDHALLVWKGADSMYRNTLGLVKSIDLSSNKLSGKIPEGITSLIGLISLNLSRNGLSGVIPLKLGWLSSLNSLDLSKNRLRGEIPESFSELNSLGVLDLSSNDLSGKIPTSTKLQSFDAPAYLGNPELCGPPLRRKCPGEESDDGPGSEVNPIEDNDDEEKWVGLGLYVSIFLGFVFGFWGVCGSLIVKRSWRYAYFNFLNKAKDRLCIFREDSRSKIQQTEVSRSSSQQDWMTSDRVFTL